MTALLLTACVGMITGAFLIFRISPMDFTLGVFRRLTAGPKSIRDEINETTHRKKPGFFRREISEAQTVLQATGKEERFPVLRDTMAALGVTGMTVTQVMGCGIQKGTTEKYRGVPVDSTLLPKIKVEVIVSKIPVDSVVEAAKKALYTGHIGDGKIFVYNVTRVVKIRTGEEDFAALQDVE